MMDKKADGYALEKCYVAITYLADEGPLKQRLSGAYLGAIMRLLPSQVPERAQKEWTALRARITAIEPSTDEGSVAATLRTVSDAEVLAIRDLLVSFIARVFDYP